MEVTVKLYHLFTSCPHVQAVDILVDKIKILDSFFKFRDGVVDRVG